MKRSNRKRTFQPRLEALEERTLMNVDVAVYDGIHIDYKISDVPDFDQGRLGLQPRNHRAAWRRQLL